MKTRSMWNRLWTYPLFAAFAGMGLLGLTNSARAQSLSAGTVSGTAGQTAAVPITMDTGSSNVVIFGVTFAVVAQDGAPAITTALSYAPASPVPAPDLTTPVPAQGKLAIGYVTNITPALSGTVQVGTLMVPIPAGATGSYQVQLTHVSAADSNSAKVTLTAQNGAITLAASSAAASEGAAVMPGALTGVTRGLNGAATAHDAGTSVAPTTAPAPTATPTSTVVPPTPSPSPTNTGGVTSPTSTPTTKPSATKTPTTAPTSPPPPSGGGEDHDGCNISSAGSAHSAWLLIITGIGLVVLRRRHR